MINCWRTWKQPKTLLSGRRAAQVTDGHGRSRTGQFLPTLPTRGPFSVHGDILVALPRNSSREIATRSLFCTEKDPTATPRRCPAGHPACAGRPNFSALSQDIIPSTTAGAVKG